MTPDARPPDSPVSALSPSQSASKSLNILVVEDDFGDYDAVARALRKIESFVARPSRAKTLEAARKLMADMRFDVFLVDYNLGSESGARFLQEIGGRSGRGATILLTGLHGNDIHDIAISAGAIGCINKSDLSPTLLETTIRYALYTHRLETELTTLLKMVQHEVGPAIAERIIERAKALPTLARQLSGPPDIEPAVPRGKGV